VFASGAEWERTVCALPPGIAPTSVSVKVDLLGFEDGSKWGPAELHESHTTLGALDATSYFLGQTDVAKLLAPVRLDVDSATEESRIQSRRMARSSSPRSFSTAVLDLSLIWHGCTRAAPSYEINDVGQKSAVASMRGTLLNSGETRWEHYYRRISRGLSGPGPLR